MTENLIPVLKMGHPIGRKDNKPMELTWHIMKTMGSRHSSCTSSGKQAAHSSLPTSPNLELRTPSSTCSTISTPTWTSHPALWESCFFLLLLMPWEVFWWVCSHGMYQRGWQGRVQGYNFVTWCKQNHPQLNVAKTKELVVDRRRNRRLEASVSIYGCLCGDSRQLQYLSVYNGNELDFI